MYFKRIYMHGFKSFAEPVTIEFHPGITCVVGPNGSGKSNLSDAIRWVLGEQSAKSLRGGKMEDVIFNGTASRKSRGMAEVTLTIDNSTGILPIEYNEVAITRRMYRSGESEYNINGNSCRLRDIRELIMDTGIGVDGYSLIGQGKISEIIENKTQGRRQIFEEAAGIVMYRTRKQDAERKLASSMPAFERVNDRIAEIEERIDGLKEDSEKASEYIKLRDRFKELEINITLRNIDDNTKKLEEIRDEIKEIIKEQSSLNDKKEKTNSLIFENKKQSYIFDSMLEENREKELALISEINELENREKIDLQKLESLEGERERINKDKNILAERLLSEEENERKAKDNLKEAQDKLSNLEEVLNQKLEDYRIKEEASLLALEAAEEAKSLIFEFTSKAQTKRVEAKGYDSIKATFSQRKKQIEEERKMSGESLLDENFKICEKKEKEIGEKLSSIQEEASKLKESHKKLSLEELDLKKKAEEIRINEGQISARKKALEELESSHEGYSYAVKYILKQNISGIYGTAGDLAKVPEGFETAIETSLGGSISNIICIDDECAKKAVNMLKNANAGRLTFIPLSSIKHRHGSFSGKDEGFIGFACDIITYEEKFRPAFEYLLGRTIIADNMDNAIRLSRKVESGTRVVTLEGEIVSQTGAITGGRYKNKQANLLERKAEIAKLSDKLDNVSEEKRKASSLLSEKTRMLKKAEDELRLLNESFGKYQRSLNEAKIETANAKNALLSFEERVEKWNNELLDIENKLNSSEEIVNNLIYDALEAEKNAREAKEDAENLFEKYDKKKKLMEKASEQITKARMDAKAAEGSLEGILAVSDNLICQLDAIRGDISLKEKRINEIDSEIESINNSKDSNICADEKIREKEEIEQKIILLNEDKSRIKKEIENQEGELAKIDEKLDNISQRKISADVKTGKIETQLDNLKEKLWETFEISYMQALDLKKEDFVISHAVKENREIKARISELGDVNISAIAEYEKVKTNYEFLKEQRDDILASRDSLNDIISTLDKTIKAKFKESFNQVAYNFEEVFKELFGGGSAKLVLTDESSPLESDIEIVAQPPEKKLQNINLLSGGEKTMTAIALMFAVLKAKPTPFCILDEVEAALDEDNMIRFAKYLKNFENIQFALITHQKTTMEHADVLYGVTMPERGITKVLSLKLGESIPGLE